MGPSLVDAYASRLQLLPRQQKSSAHYRPSSRCRGRGRPDRLINILAARVQFVSSFGWKCVASESESRRRLLNVYRTPVGDKVVETSAQQFQKSCRWKTAAVIEIPGQSLLRYRRRCHSGLRHFARTWREVLERCPARSRQRNLPSSWCVRTPAAQWRRGWTPTTGRRG